MKQPICSQGDGHDGRTVDCPTDPMHATAELERLMIDVAAEFAGITVEELDEAIERGLQTVATLADADRAYVFLKRVDGDFLDNTHEWCADGVESQKAALRQISCDTIPWLLGRLRDGQTVHLPTLADLPDEASAEHTLLESLATRSLLLVPLDGQERLMGFLGFDSVRTPRAWSVANCQMLRVFATMIAGTLARCRAEQALRESEARIRSILQAIPDLMFIHDREGWYLDHYAADSGLLAFDPRELPRKNIRDVFPEATAVTILEMFAKAHDTGQMQVMEYSLKVPNGLRHFEARISAMDDRRQLTIVRDVTEQKKLETLRQRIQTLERLGLLAGGIAHDFNNLLMGVFGNIEIAAMQLSADHAARTTLNDAHRALEQTRRLTARLLTFAKGGHPVTEPVDLRRELPETVRFNLAGSNVAAVFDLPENLWTVNADKGQLCEVIANLTINAKEAMPAGGTFHVRAENVAGRHQQSGTESCHDAVKMIFMDQGVGIPPGLLERIFDPYFSTKQTGSGLGLAMVHSIVTKHKGYVGIESMPDKGTNFTVMLPAAGTHSGTGKGKGTEPMRPPAAPEQESGESCRILLMDDEADVRMVTSRMLESVGYTVETAIDGNDAVEQYQGAMARGKPFDVTIMDLTIPGGMGGKDAVAELRKIDPSIKAIVYSGYASDPVIANYQDYGFSGCLVKPSTLMDLKTEITRVTAP